MKAKCRHATIACPTKERASLSPALRIASYRYEPRIYTNLKSYLIGQTSFFSGADISIIWVGIAPVFIQIRFVMILRIKKHGIRGKLSKIYSMTLFTDNIVQTVKFKTFYKVQAKRLKFGKNAVLGERESGVRPLRLPSAGLLESKQLNSLMKCVCGDWIKPIGWINKRDSHL